MESTQLKIFENLEQYNKNFSKNEFYPVQKAYTTPHFLVLVVRVPGKTYGIYIGRGNQYVGVYISEKMPPAFLRIQDKFLVYMRRYVVGAKIGKIEYDAERTKLFSMRYKTDTDQNEFFLGYKERELFFARKELNLIYCSWNNQIQELDHVVWPLVDIEKYYSSIDIQKYIENEEKKSVGIVEQKKREKFLVRKLNNIKKDLEIVKDWNQIENELLNDSYDLSSDALTVFGQTFKFIGLRSYWEKRDYVFKRLKKLKKGEELLKKRLEETTEELNEVKSGKIVKAMTKEKAIKILWNDTSRASKTSNHVKQEDYKTFNLGKITGLIGINANGNDYIRSISNKEHFWFHVENYPGAHIILKTDDVTNLLGNEMQIVASMLRDYSGLEILEIPIMFTQVKNLKGIKGVKGEVSAKKCKYLRYTYKDWKEIISII